MYSPPEPAAEIIILAIDAFMPKTIAQLPAGVDPATLIETPLITALLRVESGSKAYPQGDDNAIGDKGLPNPAYGPLQVRQPALDDVNRRFGTSYKAIDCLGNRPLSIWVFLRYMDIYATAARLGRAVTDQDRARIWNGGPNGYKIGPTVGYWGLATKAANKKPAVVLA